MPLGACPSPDTDALMSVIQPDGWILDTYGTIVFSNGDILGDQVVSFFHAKSDGTGYQNGRRASMIPTLAGLVRKGELTAGKVPHALVATLPAAILKEAAVWPAYAFDRNSGYAGTLPMGALLAIPPSVDVNTLGLTSRGLVLARAAQDYGVYAADRGGSGITYLAELGNAELNWTGSANDLAIITRNLKRVVNNAENNRGGGGAPRAAFAPPFYDETGTTVPLPVTDIAAPKVAIVNPVSGQVFASQVIVNIQAQTSDDIGVTKVEFFIGTATTPQCSRVLSPAVASGVYQCSWKTPRKFRGTTLTVKAYDAAGKIGSQAISIKGQ